MNFIYKEPKAYSKKRCEKIISWFEENIKYSKPGLAGNKNIKNLELTVEIKDDKSFFCLGKTLEKCIKKFKRSYSEIDKYVFPWQVNLFLRMSKYEPNNYYDIIHCENDGDKKYLNRVFAFMIFLNDIEEGGGTKFIFQNYVAKPRAGDFYIWPAGWTHLHKGVKAPFEKKYILTGWVDYK